MAIIAGPRSIRFIQVLRLALVGTITLAGFFFLRDTYQPNALWVVDIPLVGMTLLYVLSVVWLLRSLKENSALDENALYVQVFLDVLLMGIVVFYTGASSSTIQLILVLPIVLASAFVYLRGSLFSASLSVVMLGAIYYLDARGWLADYGNLYLQSPSNLDGLIGSGDVLGGLVVQDAEAAELLARFVGSSLTLFAAAFVSGYVAENQLRIISELGEVTGRLERIRLDTGDVLENIESGLITVDADGRIIFFNKAARVILELEGIEPQGRPFQTVLSGRLEPLGSLLQTALERGGFARRSEVSLERDDGTVIPLGVSPSILRGSQGIRGIVIIFQDLTEAKEVEEKFRRQDRLAVIGELSAGIAHELRNPLASISGSVEVLSGSLEVDGEDRRLMELVVNESGRINTIVEEFLNYARIERVERRPIELGSLMQDVITLARNHPAWQNRREVVCDLERCPPILADIAQMKQVFLNLLLNALQALEGPGEIRICCPPETEKRTVGRDLVEIWVQDDGPGVAPSERQRIFEPFYTTKRGGTGLGLAVVQRIVESHDGRIVYAPSQSGKSTFRIYLPLGAVVE